jgi:hypothetical protein
VPLSPIELILVLSILYGKIVFIYRGKPIHIFYTKKGIYSKKGSGIRAFLTA